MKSSLVADNIFTQSTVVNGLIAVLFLEVLILPHVAR